MIRCCKKGMESYRYDGELDYEMSKLCAKILHRVINDGGIVGKRNQLVRTGL